MIIRLLLSSILILKLSFVFAQFNAETKPKNIILMIGDGMGFQHLKVSEYYRGDSTRNFWSQFPVHLAASTFPAFSKDGINIGYNPRLTWENMGYVMSGYTCSAAGGTALATGFKTKKDYIGKDVYQKPLLNLIQIAKANKKSAGVVSSVPFSHATPASFVVHNISRENYGQISFDMLINSQLDVLMGSGHPMFDKNGGISDKENYKYILSKELFTQIIDKQTQIKINNEIYSVQDVDFDKIPDYWTFTDIRQEIINIANGNIVPKRLFALAPVFETLSYGRAGKSLLPFDIPINKEIPLLEEMSIAALEVLNRNENGFFLMIEGGAIDWAGHDRDLVRLIEEQILFENSIQAVINWISKKEMWEETLLIVVADHETGYLIGNWESSVGFVDVINQGKGNLPQAQFFSEDHTNHLVPFFAKGKSSNNFKFFARNYDPKRNYFLDITDIALNLKFIWNPTLAAFPQIIHSPKDSYKTITLAAPIQGLEYKWFKNNVLIPSENSHQLSVKVGYNDTYYAIGQNSTNYFKSNEVKVYSEKPTIKSEPKSKNKLRIKLKLKKD